MGNATHHGVSLSFCFSILLPASPLLWGEKLIGTSSSFLERIPLSLIRILPRLARGVWMVIQCVLRVFISVIIRPRSRPSRVLLCRSRWARRRLLVSRRSRISSGGMRSGIEELSGDWFSILLFISQDFFWR